MTGRPPRARGMSALERALLFDRPLSSLDHEETWRHHELTAGDAMMFAGSKLGLLWREHRDEVLAAWIVERPGTRPSAWWRYEAGMPAPSEIGAQTAYLAQHGLLQPGESAALLAACVGRRG
jgi:hypothetical protein